MKRNSQKKDINRTGVAAQNQPVLQDLSTKLLQDLLGKLEKLNLFLFEYCDDTLMGWMVITILQLI